LSEIFVSSGILPRTKRASFYDVASHKYEKNSQLRILTLYYTIYLCLSAEFLSQIVKDTLAFPKGAAVWLHYFTISTLIFAVLKYFALRISEGDTLCVGNNSLFELDNFSPPRFTSIFIWICVKMAEVWYLPTTFSIGTETILENYKGHISTTIAIKQTNVGEESETNLHGRKKRPEKINHKDKN